MNDCSSVRQRLACAHTAVVFLVRSQRKRTKKGQLQCMYRQLPKFTHTRTHTRTHARTHARTKGHIDYFFCSSSWDVTASHDFRRVVVNSPPAMRRRSSLSETSEWDSPKCIEYQVHPWILYSQKKKAPVIERRDVRLLWLYLARDSPSILPNIKKKNPGQDSPQPARPWRDRGAAERTNLASQELSTHYCLAPPEIFVLRKTPLNWN